MAETDRFDPEIVADWPNDLRNAAIDFRSEIEDIVREEGVSFLKATKMFSNEENIMLEAEAAGYVEPDLISGEEGLGMEDHLAILVSKIFQGGDVESSPGSHNFKDAGKQIDKWMDQGDAGRAVVQEVIDSIMAIRDGINPEGVARVVETIAKKAPRHFGRPKAPDSKNLFSFRFDTTPMDQFVNRFSSKTLFDKNDVQALSDLIYKKTVMQQVSSTLNDYLENKFVGVDQKLDNNYLIATQYNQVLLSSRGRIQSVSRQLQKFKLDQMQALKKYIIERMKSKAATYLYESEAFNIGSPTKIVAEAEGLLTRAVADLLIIDVDFEVLSNEFNRFVSQNRLVTFKFDPSKLVVLMNISTTTDILLEQVIKPFISKIYGLSNVGSRMSVKYDAGGTRSELGLVSESGAGMAGGGLFYSLQTALTGIRTDLNYFIHVAETNIGSFKIDPSLKKVVDAIIGSETRNILKKKAAAASGESYSGYKSKVKGKSVYHIFYITKVLTDNLMYLGVDNQTIKEIRDSISNEIFDRVGLMDSVQNLVESRLMEGMLD